MDWKKKKKEKKNEPNCVQQCSFTPKKIIDKNLGNFFSRVNCKFDQFSKFWGKNSTIFAA
jgi:hypothetical protein